MKYDIQRCILLIGITRGFGKTREQAIKDDTRYGFETLLEDAFIADNARRGAEREHGGDVNKNFTADYEPPGEYIMNQAYRSILLGFGAAKSNERCWLTQLDRV
jgi:hypothetical protein